MKQPIEIRNLHEHEPDAYVPLCATADFINEVSLSVSRCGIKN